MEELISVIIPVYNVEQYLDRCMKSILAQSYKNLEIILVNDSSKDNSKQICLSYLSDERVLFIEHENNEGLSSARNSGLEVAHGKYVVFIDSDDYVEAYMIENLYKCLKKTKADTVIGGFKRIIQDKAITYDNQYAGIVYEGQEEITNKVLKKMLGSDGIDSIEMSVWKVLFSMNIIQQNHIRFPDKKYLCEDIMFDLSYFALCNRVSMCEDTSYCYCLNESSLSQKYICDRFELLRFQAAEMRKGAITLGFDENAFVRIDNFFLGNCIHHMKTIATYRKNLGKKKCLTAYEKICSDKDIRSVRWKELVDCFRGKERILFEFVRRNQIHLLFYYLCILMTIRGIVRSRSNKK